MNRDNRSGIRLYLVSLLISALFCFFGTALAQEISESENSQIILETLESSAMTEMTATAEPAPTATIDLEEQKQLDLETGIFAAVSAPIVLTESELSLTSVYESEIEIASLHSDHPYSANTLQLAKFKSDGALKLSVRFTSDFNLERGYDTLGIYFYDEAIDSYRLLDGKTYSGDDLAGAIVEIPGDSVVFRFESDETIGANGWQVAEIQAEFPETQPSALPGEATPFSESPESASEPPEPSPESLVSSSQLPGPEEEVMAPTEQTDANPEQDSMTDSEAQIPAASAETATPEAVVLPSVSEIPTVTPDMAPNEDDLRSAVANRFRQQFAIAPSSEIFVEEIQEQSALAAGLVGKYASGEDSGPEVYVFIAAYEAEMWQIYFEGSSEFAERLASFPEEILPAGFSKDSVIEGDSRGSVPANYSLPWPVGEQWKMTGGPHRNDTSVAGQAWSAVDFQGIYPVNKVTAVQEGTVTVIPSCRNFVLISHPDGSKTGYYHLNNIQVYNGQQVGRGAYLGNTSQEAGCGGSATGPHVHFSIRNSANNGIDIRTVNIGGWKAISHGAEYSGCMVRNSDGYQACRGTANTVHNDGSIGGGSGPQPPQNPDCPGTTTNEAYVCGPELMPLPGDPCTTFWFTFTGFNGHTAYLTENAYAPSMNTNFGVWRPNFLAAGTYRVEAFVASHPPMDIPCSWGMASLHQDTSNAHYEIHHANGVNTVVGNQLPLDNSWLNLGEYFFQEGTNGYVLLRDLTGEPQASTNVSFSAMRFILTSPAPNPVPLVTGVDPTSVISGSQAIQLHVYGNQFVNGASVYWNGSARSTSFIDPNHLIATIPATDLQSAGDANVSVVNPAPGGGESNRVNFNIKVPLGRPSINPITRVSATSLRVSWNAIPGATGYRLWRSETSPTSGYNWAVNVGQVTAVVTNVSSTKTYYYRVAALSGTDLGPLSMPAAGTTMMGTPTINPITRVSANSLRVSWNAIPGATGYRLWRSETSPTSGYTWSVNTGMLTAVVTKVPSTKPYYYRVAALFGSTVGPLSAPVIGTTDIGKPTIYRIKRQSNSVLEIAWTAIPGATGYRLWRSETSPTSGYTWAINLSNQTTVRTSVPSTKTYYYRVAALFGSALGSLSAPVAGTTAMARPTLKPAVNLANGIFRLSWNDILGADSYILYRSEAGPASGFTYAMNVGKRTSVDTLSPNIYRRYYYKIAGVFNGQVGPLSNVISAMHNPVTFRALSIGEGAYDISTGYGPLSGTVRDSEQMRNALNLFKYGTTRYIRNVQVADVNKAGVFAQIQSAFAGSDPNDVSLFFFSGHGDYRDGISYIAAVDGSAANEISSYELRAALDTVPGTTFVLIDACRSGGMIGRNDGNSAIPFDMEKFASGFNAAFAGSSKQLNSQGYYVITAAASYEDSQEIGGQGAAYGIFTKALLEGIGWNHISGTPRPNLSADFDRDGMVNFLEAFTYARNAALLENPYQHAQMYPEGATVLFYAR